MLLLTAVAFASSPNVKIDLTLPQGAKDAGLDETQLESDMEGAIEGQLHTVDTSKYLAEMADANVLSAKGLGVDYASDMQRFEVGGGIGTAVNGAGFALTAGDGGLPTSGFALQIGVMAGLNLGAFSDKDSALRRFRIYVNGMSATTRRDPFDATFLNYGGHLQIQVVKGGDKTDGVRWGGLDLTGGYEYSSYLLHLGQSYPIETDNLSWESSGDFDLKAHSQSIPLELSTNLHVFVVTVFVGAGFDYNISGAADASIDVKGDLTVKYDDQSENAGSAEVAITDTGGAGKYVIRGFGGVQADIFFVKVYGQLNVTADESVGAHAGVRLAF